MNHVLTDDEIFEHEHRILETNAISKFSPLDIENQLITIRNCQREIRRLRKALELFKNQNNWYVRSSIEDDDYLWNRREDPTEIAQRALDGDD